MPKCSFSNAMSSGCGFVFSPNALAIAAKNALEIKQYHKSETYAEHLKYFKNSMFVSALYNYRMIT